MKKAKLLLSLVMILAVVSTVLFACANVDVALEFMVNGEVYHTINTQGEEMVTLPSDPQVEGYVFKGWYFDEGIWQQPFTVNSLLDQPLTENLRVYARLITVEEQNRVFSVSFNSMGGTEVQSQQIVRGNLVVEPGVSRLGFIFGGWYLEPDCITKWDFATSRVEGDVTLYAKWIDDVSVPKIVGIVGGKVDDTDVYLDVEPGVTQVDLSAIVQVSESNSWQLYADKEGQTLIPTKLATNINDGENLFYAVVSNSNGNVSRFFTLHIYRKFKTNVYFVANGNVVYTAYNVLTHNYVSSANAPKTITGYVLAWEDSYYISEPELRVHAKATANEYKINIDVNGGVLEEGTATEYTVRYDSNYSLPVPTREHYTFNGWYYSSTQATYSSGNSCSVFKWTKDVILTAKWELNKYRLNVSSDNTSYGTVNNVSGLHYYDYNVTLIATTKPGCTFVGWFYNDELVSENLSYTIRIPDYTTDYVAKWSKVILSKNVSGAGSVGGLDSTYFVGDTATATARTNSGYTWMGWYDGETKVSEGTSLNLEVTMGTEDKTYTAKWMRCPVTLVKNISNAGSVSGVSGATKLGAETTITASTYSGYTWLGWYDGDTKVSEGTSLSYTFVMGTESKTYTAKWMRCPVTLAKNISNAGSVSGVNGATKLGAETTITASTYSGYTWLGWYVGDTLVTEDKSYTFIMQEEAVVYTAKWTVYTVTTNTNLSVGGSYTKYTEKKITVGENVSLTATTKNGYTWLGWYDGETKVSEGASLNYTFIMGAESKTYTAKWMKCPVTLEKNVSDIGSVSGVNGATAVGGETTITATSESTEYTWLGWYVGDTLVTEDESYTFIMQEEAIVYTAKWVKFTLSTTSNYNVAGEYTSISSQVFKAGTSISLTATTKEYFVWKGWYDGETLVSSSENFDYTMPKKDVILTATWEPVPELSKFIFIIDTDSLIVTGVRDTTIKEIMVPNSVTKIEKGAFSGCTSLESITIPFVGDGSSNTHFGYIFGADSYSSNKTCVPASLKKVVITGGESIGDYAFYNCTSLTSIEIPSSVTSIGNYAFSGCTSLISVNYLGTIESWCGITFGNATANPLNNGAKLYLNGELVTELVIPNTITEIKAYAFRGCTSLTSVVIPNSVTSIGSSAFYECTSLTSVEIPSSVTGIGGGAFSGCTSLASIEIPSSIISIGNSAFYNCTSLTSIVIPSSVTSIGFGAFYGCRSLEEMTIPFVGDGSSNTNFGYIFGTSDYSYNDIKVPTSLKKVVITGGESIGEYAFYCCKSLTSIVIPSSVTSIGSSAFSGCRSLTSVNYLGTIESWCGITFGDSYANPLCYAQKLYLNGELVTELVIPNSVTEIKAYAFRGCTSLTSVVIPDSVTNIDYYAFAYCTSLTSVVIEDGVTSIGGAAFRNCTSLTSVEIPSSVTSIGDGVFSDCSSLVNISVDEGNTAYKSIDGNLYTKDDKILLQYAKGKTDTSFIIPDSVTSIGNSAFYGCTSLTSIEIPSSVKSIGDKAFYGCTSLTSVVIPSSVTSIGKSAFRECTSLTSVVIEDGVTSIGDQAFEGCTSLTSIEIPSSVTSIGERAFLDCTSLTSIVIPSSVTWIGERAFDGCTSLTSIEIPSSVTSIGEFAFYGCTSLASIVIPSSVTSIDYQAFSYCKSLTSIVIPSSVTWIGNYAFSSCTSLTSIVIPSSVTSIGSYAFDGCTSLTIYCKASSKPICWYDYWNSSDRPVWWGCDASNLKIIDGVQYYVKDGRAMVTGHEANVTNVTILSTIENNGVTYSVTSIGYRAFYECTSLTSIVIPSSVKSIASHAFSDCTSLRSIVIPSSVTSIGYCAFYECKSLRSIEIPSSVTSIGQYAFLNCTSLTIYCEAESKPSGWESKWNGNSPVVWGYSENA